MRDPQFNQYGFYPKASSKPNVAELKFSLATICRRSSCRQPSPGRCCIGNSGSVACGLLPVPCRRGTRRGRDGRRSGVASIVWLSSVIVAQRTALDRVDPLVGSRNGGNTTPGAQVPFGRIPFGPETTLQNEDHATSGYNPVATSSLSYTHEMGTGGPSKYGNFRATDRGPALSAEPEFSLKDEHAWLILRHHAGPVCGQAPNSPHRASVGLPATLLFREHQANLLLDVFFGIRMNAGESAVSSLPQSATGGSDRDRRSSRGRFVQMIGGWNPSPIRSISPQSLAAMRTRPAPTSTKPTPVAITPRALIRPEVVGRLSQPVGRLLPVRRRPADSR